MNPNLQNTFDGFFREPTVEKYRAIQYFHGRAPELNLFFAQVKDVYGYGGDLSEEEKKKLQKYRERLMKCPPESIKVKQLRDIWTLYSATGDRSYVERVMSLSKKHPDNVLRLACESTLSDFSSRGLL